MLLFQIGAPYTKTILPAFLDLAHRLALKLPAKVLMERLVILSIVSGSKMLAQLLICIKRTFRHHKQVVLPKPNAMLSPSYLGPNPDIAYITLSAISKP